jgi:hypothetical protein
MMMMLPVYVCLYSKGDDRLHLFAQCQILLFLLAAGIFHNDGVTNSLTN